MGALLERDERLGEARKAYELMIEAGLPQADWAATQLERLGGRSGPSAVPGAGG